MKLTQVRDEAEVTALAGYADAESAVKFTVNDQEIAFVIVQDAMGTFALFTEVDPFTGAQWAYELKA